MKCLILAAGYATRLYPLTENFPKPLLEVQGKTILDWLVEDIHSAGVVDEFVVISNHRYAHHFEAWAKDQSYNITVLDDGTESNETRLGAVKDIQFAVEQLNLADDLLIIAGDNLLDFSLTRFVAYSQEKNTVSMLRYYEPRREKLLRCGVVTVDETDRVVQMTEKSPQPATNWCCSPFYYFPKEEVKWIAEGIAQGCGTDAPGNLFVWLCHKTPVYSMEIPGKRYDIGDMESYAQVQKEYRGILL